MQGLGLFTLEELKFSPSGLLYTRGPSQYKIPAVCDVPLCFNVHLLSDSYNPPTIYSSKVRGHDFQSKPLIVQLEMNLFFHMILWLCRVSESPPCSWAVRCSLPSKTPWLLPAQSLV